MLKLNWEIYRAIRGNIEHLKIMLDAKLLSGKNNYEVMYV